MTRVWQLTDFGILAIALAYAVFKEGGYSVIGWNICLLLIGIAALVHWLRRVSVNTAPAMEPSLAWAIVLAPLYVAFQLVPLPLFLLRIVSPARAEVVASLGTVMPAPTFASLSINPAATFSHLLNIIAFALTFLLARELGWRFWQRRRWTIAIPLIAIAAAEAGIGLLQAAGGDPAHGTYPNRNHFAGLLGMVLPITVACAFAFLGRRSLDRASPTSNRLGACALLLLAGLMLLGLIYSLSKMGFLAGLFGLFAMGVLALATTTQGTKKRLVGIASLAACGLLAFVALPTDQLVGRFGLLFSDVAASDGRWNTWLDTLPLISSYPLFGSGMGTYGTAFLKHQTSNLDLAYIYAHNDYLQLVSELGAVGFVVFMVLMLTVLVRAVRAVTQGQGKNARLLGLGCTGAIAAISLHSLTDFNMYMPANALLLAWISGMAVCLPMRSEPDRQVPGSVFFRRGAVALACLLVIYAPASIAAETVFRDSLEAERQFCRFGICHTDAAIDAQTEERGSVAAVPVALLLEAVRRDPAAPGRWCDLGEAMLRAGRLEQASSCFSTALALSPNNPSVLLRAADFYHHLNDDRRALAHISRVLKETPHYDANVFDWFSETALPAAQILSDGLPGNARASRAYLRYLMGAKKFDDATTVWNSALSHRYADDPLAHEYVNFLFTDQLYEMAARSWAAYVGTRRNGYQESNWLFNGDFEFELSGVPFDWRMGDLNDDVEVSLDRNVARAGTQSLRIRFGGKKNVDYSNTSQLLFVTPGVYRFQAFVRAEDITTDQGVGFHIFDTADWARLDVRTEQVCGTTGWVKLEQTIRVSQETRLIGVQVVRPPSLKFDSHIAGTAWIDSVSLAKLD